MVNHADPCLLSLVLSCPELVALTDINTLEIKSSKKNWRLFLRSSKTKMSGNNTLQMSTKIEGEKQLKRFESIKDEK